jgi:hypothetical protein
MAWRIVKQPNGFYARFSDIVDNFTAMNMTESEAFELCRDDLGEDDAKRKVQAGREDWKPWTSGVPGSGLERWQESIDTIKSVHGKKAAQQALALDASPDGAVLV